MKKKIKVSLDDIDFNKMNNDEKMNKTHDLIDLYLNNKEYYIVGYLINKFLAHVTITEVMRNCYLKAPQLIDDIFKDNIEEKNNYDDVYAYCLEVVGISSGFYKSMIIVKLIKLLGVLVPFVLLTLLTIFTKLNLIISILLMIIDLIIFLGIFPKLSHLIFRENNIERHKIEIDQKLIDLFKEDEEKEKHLASYQELFTAKDDIEVANAILHFQKTKI